MNLPAEEQSSTSPLASGMLRSPACHVFAPLQCWSYRETDCVARFQEIIKEMIVCEISLESKGEMFIDVEFQAASESIEVSPIRFLFGRRELTYHELGDRVGRTRGCDDLQSAQIGSNEERD